MIERVIENDILPIDIETIKWMNAKRELQSPRLFERAITKLNQQNGTKINDIYFTNKAYRRLGHSPFDLRNLKDELIPGFDCGGYFRDDNGKICLIYDTYHTYDPENPEDPNNDRASPRKFMEMCNIPAYHMEHRTIPGNAYSDRKTMFNLHRTNVFVIRLDP